MKSLFTLLILCSSIISLNAQQLEWEQRLGDNSMAYYGPNKITVDNSYNVFVTGLRSQNDTVSLVTAKYNSSGVLQWANYYTYNTMISPQAPVGIVSDNSGNVYIASQRYTLNYNAIVVVKYSYNGTEEWVRAYSAPDSAEDDVEPSDIKIDNSGNIFIAGIQKIFGSISYYDILLLKYSNSGVLMFSSTYNLNDGGEQGKFLELDVNGNIYVLGEGLHGGNNDFTLVKFSSAGTVIWGTTLISLNPQMTHIPGGLAVDASDNCFITGSSYNNFITAKFSSTGALLWQDTSTGSTYSSKSIGLDRNGYPFIAGKHDSTIETIKFDPVSGTRLWTRSFNQPGQRPVIVNKLKVDDFGNIFISGNGDGSAQQQNFILLKYANNGSLQWSTTYNSSYNNQDVSYDLAIDRNGFVYVAGKSWKNASPWWDIVTLKYKDQSASSYTFKRNNVNKPITDLSLTYDTLFTFQGMNMSPFYVNDISLTIDTILHTKDSDLEISLVHQSVTDTVIYQVGGTGANFIGTVLDDSSSTPIANGTAPFTGTFKPTKPLSQLLNTDPEGAWILRIYDRATGNTGMLNAWSLTLTVSQNPIGISQINTEVPEGFKLYQNYPNPFNPVTKIQFSVPSSQFVVIKIFDVTGREIATLVNGQLNPGTYEVDFNGSNFASGIYFYRLSAGDGSTGSPQGFTETKKMILIK